MKALFYTWKTTINIFMCLTWRQFYRAGIYRKMNNVDSSKTLITYSDWLFDISLKTKTNFKALKYTISLYYISFVFKLSYFILSYQLTIVFYIPGKCKVYKYIYFSLVQSMVCLTSHNFIYLMLLCIETCLKNVPK